MAIGKVKWFSNQKGYGYIQTIEGEDIFIHFSAIQAEGFKTLGQGQEVEFEISRGPRAHRPKTWSPSNSFMAIYRQSSRILCRILFLSYNL